MNKVVLIGRLTKNPEIRYSQSNNILVAKFPLDVNRKYVKPGEERQTDFFDIVAWGKQGEFCSKYFKKGQQVGIIGRLQTRTWNDDKGRHYITEVIVEETYFADSQQKTDETISNDNNNSASIQSTIPVETENSGDYITSDDDLPF